jgi:glycosyltransferase involved in cell wall biosynthesis
MAMGVPVVTSRVAAGGVDAEAETHLLVADSAQEITRSVLRIVENPAERRRLALAGRQRMLSHHAWARSMQRLDGIIERCRHVHAARQPNEKIESSA